jgi:hypothetical protein
MTCRRVLLALGAGTFALLIWRARGIRYRSSSRIIQEAGQRMARELRELAELGRIMSAETRI